MAIRYKLRELANKSNKNPNRTKFNWNSIPSIGISMNDIFIVSPFILHSTTCTLRKHIFRAHNPNSRHARRRRSGWNFHKPGFHHQYHLHRPKPSREVVNVLDAQQWGKALGFRYILLLGRGRIKTFLFQSVWRCWLKGNLWLKFMATKGSSLNI